MMYRKGDFVANLVAQNFHGEALDVSDMAMFLSDAIKTANTLLGANHEQTLAGLDITLVGSEKGFLQCYADVLTAAGANVRLVDDADTALFETDTAFMTGDMATLTIVPYLFSGDETFKRAQLWRNQGDIMVTMYQTPISVLLDIETWWTNQHNDK